VKGLRKGAALSEMGRVFGGTLRASAAVGVANQVLSSAASLALTLFLARSLSPSEFGAYGLGFAGAILLVGLGNGVFITQMVVHLPEQPEKSRPTFAAEALGGLLIAALALVLLSAIIALASSRGGSWGVLGALAPGAAIAAAGMLLRDFAVRHAFSERAEGRALLSNAVAATALALFFGVALPLGAVRGGTALVISGIATGAGGIAGIARSRLPLRAMRVQAKSAVWRLAAGGGAWASGGVVATWVQTQAYSYATAAIADLADLGRVNAARLFVSPALFLIPTVNQFLMPRLAERRAVAPAAAFAMQRGALLLMLSAAVAFGGLLLAVPDGILSRIVGPKYVGLSGVVAAWIVYTATTIVRDSASIMLQVLRRFRELALVNFVSAPVAALAALWFTTQWGGSGAILGAACGEVVLAVLLWRAVEHERRMH
jgi:O-antigen/teichoic acid export membrane protein